MSTPEEAVFPGIPVERIPTGPAPTGRIPNVPGSEIVAPGPSALSEEDAEAVNVIKGELAKGRSLEELHGLLDGDPEMQDFLRTGAELGLFEGDIPLRPVLTETDREFDRIIGQPALPPIPPSDAGSQLDVIDQDREGFAGGIAGGAVGDVAANALNVQRAMKRGQLGMATFPATVTSLIASGLTGAGNIFEEQTGIDISRSFPHPVFQGADLAFGAIHDLFTPEDINGFEFPDDDPPRSALDGLSRLRPFESTVNALSQEGVPEIFRPDPRFPEGTSNTQDFIATLGLHFAENIGAASLAIPATLGSSSLSNPQALAALEGVAAMGGAFARTWAQAMNLPPLGQFGMELMGGTIPVVGMSISRAVQHHGRQALEMALKAFGKATDAVDPRNEVVQLLADTAKATGQDPKDIARALEDPTNPLHAELWNAITGGEATNNPTVLALEMAMLNQNPAHRAAVQAVDQNLGVALNKVVDAALGGGNPIEAMQAIRMGSRYQQIRLMQAMQQQIARIQSAVAQAQRLTADGTGNASTLLHNITIDFQNTMKAIRAHEKQLWDMIPNAVTDTKRLIAARDKLQRTRGITFSKDVRSQMKQLLNNLDPTIQTSEMFQIRTNLLEQARAIRKKNPSGANALMELADATWLALKGDTRQQVVTGPGGVQTLTAGFQNRHDAAVGFSRLKHDVVDKSIVGILLEDGNPNSAVAAISSPGPKGLQSIQTVKALNAIQSSAAGPAVPDLGMTEMRALILDKLNVAAGDPKAMNVRGIERFMQENATGYGASLKELGLWDTARNLLNSARHQAKWEFGLDSEGIKGELKRLNEQTLIGQLSEGTDTNPVRLREAISGFFGDPKGGTKLGALRRDIESNARKLNSSPDEISGALNGLRKATWEALSDRLFNITEEGVSVKGNPTKTLRDLRGTLESSGLFNKDQMDMMEFTARTLARRDAARFTSQGVENLAGLGDNTILGNVAGYLGARGGAIIGGGAGAQLRTAAKLSKMFDKLATKAGKQTFMQLLGEALEPTPAGRALLRTLFSEAGDLKAQGNILSAFEMMARTGLPFGLGTSTAFTAQQEFGIEARDQLTDQPQAEE